MCLFQAEDGIRHMIVTGVRTCALPICRAVDARAAAHLWERIYQALQEVRGGARVDSPTAESKYRALERYSIDLTEAARQAKLDPVIGREDEIKRVMQVLNRRTKNNPVIIGEAGVGKTAIAQGLAH